MSEFNFVEVDAEKIINEMIDGYTSAVFDATGKKITLHKSDPIRIFLYAQALEKIQILNLINYTGKQNLLAYAEGHYLDAIGDGKTTSRNPASPAFCLARFDYSVPDTEERIIPKGTRIVGSDNIFFHLEHDHVVEAEKTYTDVKMYCTIQGTVGNSIPAGRLNVLVDPIPFVQQVSNLTVTEGGTDVECDEKYRARIRLAPEGFSVAGPELAYVNLAMQFDPTIQNVKVFSPSAGIVNVMVIKKDGVIPDENYIEELHNYISAKDKRPLTDYVQVSVPKPVHYDISLTYYIDVDSTNTTSVQDAVSAAVQEYSLWQKRKIGRNINPAELIRLIKNAGASKIEISSPTYAVINEDELALAQNINIEFGGSEDE